MADFPNPHDRFFKEVFGRPETASDFLANYLPPEAAEALDLLNLELVKDSFVDSKLREYFSDLLYHVGLKRGEGAFVYVLFEHKSAPDEWVGFQSRRDRDFLQGASCLVDANIFLIQFAFHPM